MTRDEIKQLIHIMAKTYPTSFNMDQVELKKTVDAWEFFLEEYDGASIGNALKTYISTSNSAFAPSISQLIALTTKPEEMTGMSEGEAWTIVRKAISRGNYYSEQDFNDFPPEIQKVVGSPSQIRIWASDSEFNEGVESSNFKRSYKQVCKNKIEYERMPQSVKNLIGQTKATGIECEKGE